MAKPCDVIGDHLFLIGLADLDVDSRTGCGDGPTPRQIGLVVDTDPEIAKPGTDQFAHRCGIGTDAAREDQPIETFERRGQRDQVAPNMIAEVPDCLGRGSVMALDKNIHIAAYPRQAEEARPGSQQVPENLRRHSRFPLKVQDQTGIDIAGPRPHGHAGDRRKPHRGFDRPATPDGGQ